MTTVPKSLGIIFCFYLYFSCVVEFCCCHWTCVFVFSLSCRNIVMRELAPQFQIPWSIPTEAEDIPIVPTTSGTMWVATVELHVWQKYNYKNICSIIVYIGDLVFFYFEKIQVKCKCTIIFFCLCLRMELRCVIAIIRHGDRTPKQKMKMEVRNPMYVKDVFSLVFNHCAVLLLLVFYNNLFYLGSLICLKNMGDTNQGNWNWRSQNNYR